MAFRRGLNFKFRAFSVGSTLGALFRPGRIPGRLWAETSNRLSALFEPSIGAVLSCRGVSPDT
jgi:hypothetical protein